MLKGRLILQALGIAVLTGIYSSTLHARTEESGTGWCNENFPYTGHLFGTLDMLGYGAVCKQGYHSDFQTGTNCNVHPDAEASSCS